jgi:hypothetical protein
MPDECFHRALYVKSVSGKKLQNTVQVHYASRNIELPSGGVQHLKHHYLCENFLFHHNFTVKVKFSFMPESTVGKVMFAGCRADSGFLRESFIMRSSFISAGSREFAFGIWHSTNSLF